MAPLAEAEDTHWVTKSLPSAASILGSSTGQRVKGPQEPFSSVAAAAFAVDIPRETKAVKAVSAHSSEAFTPFLTAFMLPFPVGPTP